MEKVIRPKWKPCNIVLLVCGMVLVTLGLSSCLLQDVMQTWLLSLIRTQMALTQGSQMFKMWSDPPVEPIMRCYIYNFTNIEEFLAGEDTTPTLNEVGPYSYSAKHEKDVTKWAEDGTLTFKTR